MYLINKQVNFENYRDALFKKQKYTHNEHATLSAPQHL